MPSFAEIIMAQNNEALDQLLYEELVQKNQLVQNQVNASFDLSILPPWFFQQINQLKCYLMYSDSILTCFIVDMNQYCPRIQINLETREAFIIINDPFEIDEPFSIVIEFPNVNNQNVFQSVVCAAYDYYTWSLTFNFNFDTCILCYRDRYNYYMNN
jgi:hypothetical protein